MTRDLLVGLRAARQSVAQRHGGRARPSMPFWRRVFIAIAEARQKKADDVVAQYLLRHAENQDRNKR